MASTISIESLTEQLLALSPKERAKAISAVIIGGAGKAKSKSKSKATAETDSDTPKKAANNYITFTNTYVWPVLKAHADSLDEEDKKALRSVSARTQIAAALYAPIKALEASEQQEAMEAVTEKDILAAYINWKKNPPVAHCKADKEAKASSVASGGSKASAKSKAEPESEEDADAKRAAKTAKAKATREANKAKAALEAAAAAAAAMALPDSDNEEDEEEAVVAPAVAAVAAVAVSSASAASEAEEAEEDEEAEAEAEDAEVELKEWVSPAELRKGKGLETFLSAEVDGKTYLFEKDTRAYVGLYMAKVKKINSKAENPLA